MIEMINGKAYVKKGDKVYEVSGGGSGGGLPEVVLTTPVDNGVMFTDEENAALSAAVATGKPVIVECTIMDTPNIVMVMHNFSGIGFIAVYANYNFAFMLTEDGAWTAIVQLINPLPEVTEDDEGAFVQVSGGAYTLVRLQDVSKEGA